MNEWINQSINRVLLERLSAFDKHRNCILLKSSFKCIDLKASKSHFLFNLIQKSLNSNKTSRLINLTVLISTTIIFSFNSVKKSDYISSMRHLISHGASMNSPIFIVVLFNWTYWLWWHGLNNFILFIKCLF